jgi:hypothetical protein
VAPAVPAARAATVPSREGAAGFVPAEFREMIVRAAVHWDVSAALLGGAGALAVPEFEVRLVA